MYRGQALHAVELGGSAAGTTAAVVGCGPLGLLIVQSLRAAGVRVELATDPLAHRAAAALELLVSRRATGKVVLTR